MARNLADPRTQLARLFPALEATAAEVAPVAETQAALFGNLDTTFTALASVARPYLQQFISESPPTMRQAIDDFPRQRPFLRNSAAFFAELRPGISTLPSSAPVLADTFEIGQRTLVRTPPLNRQLASVFDSLAEFAEDPLVPAGIRRLRDTARSLRPTIAFLTPVQTRCNYVTLLLRNAGSLFSEGDGNGTGQRFVIVSPPTGPNAESGPSSAPANGPEPDNYLHSNPYPNTASPGQPQECEAGNESYLTGRQVIGNQPGNQGTRVDQHRGRRRREAPMRNRGGMTRFTAGIIGLVVIVVGVYFAFAKDIPFTEPYRFSAVFDNSSALQVNSPVRIAGVDVGKVAEVEPVGGDSTASEVTIKMQERGLPIHRDARLKIRPRIFLEGNFFVDLRPGTPASPDLPDGGTIGPAQTSAPVQIDQVLGTLKSDARKDLQDLLDGYGEALAGTPEPGEDADQDPDTRGQTAAESLNDSLQDAPAALRDSSIVADAFRGSERGDLPRLILGLQRTTGALADREGSLKDLIANFDTTTGCSGHRAGQPAWHGARAAPGAEGGQPRAGLAERLVPRHPRLRARDPARGARDPGLDRGHAALDRPGAPAGVQPRAGRAGRRPSALHP